MMIEGMIEQQYNVYGIKYTDYIRVSLIHTLQSFHMGIISVPSHALPSIFSFPRDPCVHFR